MKPSQNRHYAQMLPVVMIVLIAMPMLSVAASAGMPWEAPLTTVMNSITGPVVQTAAVIAITVFGLTLAFGGGGGALRTAIGILFGISIAFGAASFFLSFFGFSGALVVP